MSLIKQWLSHPGRELFDRVLASRAAFAQMESGLALSLDREKSASEGTATNDTCHYPVADSNARQAAEAMTASDVLAWFSDAKDNEFYSLQLELQLGSE